MKTRGGAGRGQGRKPVLTLTKRLLVGAECDELQRKSGEAEAETRHEQAAGVNKLREMQERVNSIRPPVPMPGKVLNELGHRAAKQKISRAGDIIKKMGSLNLVRGYSLAARGKTRSEICTEIAAKHQITKRRVEACWKEYRAFIKGQ